MEVKKNNKAIGSLSIHRRVLLAGIIAAILAFSVTGGVYAITTGQVINGTVHLTILEAPTGPANITISSIDVSDGQWSMLCDPQNPPCGLGHGEWTVSAVQGNSIELSVMLRNDGGEDGYLTPSVIINGQQYDGNMQIELSGGCYGYWDVPGIISGGGNALATFVIDISSEATPGAIPDFQLLLEIE